MSSANPLFLARKGRRLYTASNGDATVAVGDKSLHEGVFSPGELLQLALAGCAALSADQTLAKQLGDDTAIFAGVDAELDSDANRYRAIAVQLVATLGDLTEDERGALIEKAIAAIDRHCTVAHTVRFDDLDYRVEIVDETA